MRPQLTKKGDREKREDKEGPSAACGPVRFTASVDDYHRRMRALDVHMQEGDVRKLTTVSGPRDR